MYVVRNRVRLHEVTMSKYIIVIEIIRRAYVDISPKMVKMRINRLCKRINTWLSRQARMG